VILGSRTRDAKIMWHTNKMGVFVSDPDASHDCCYYDILFRQPIHIISMIEPDTVITAVATHKGKGNSVKKLSPNYKIVGRVYPPEIRPHSGVFSR
jgi:hypothetical protein